MEHFVPFDKSIHYKEFYEMNIEYMTWIMKELDLNFQIDSLTMINTSIPQIVDDTIRAFMDLNPDDGVLLIAEVDGKVAGMGVIKKLSDTIGEIKRMYVKPDYRGRGYGRQMLTHLIVEGRSRGCTAFKLDTPKFAYAAQHIYHNFGFKNTDEYPESEIPQTLRKYWMYMAVED